MYIKINLKIFIFLIIFLLTRQIELYTLLMLFALIHELGHLLAGVLVGFKPEFLAIMPIGFSVKFKTTYKDYDKRIKRANLLSIKKIIISTAGPLTNLIIILISIIYYKITTNLYILNIPIDIIIYSNILIFIFNLLPIYPLDGGRILKEIICIFKGMKLSYIYIAKVSKIIIIILTMISSIMILIYKNIAILIIIIYLWIIVIKRS